MKIATHPDLTENRVCELCGQDKYCCSPLYDFYGRIDPVDGYCKDFSIKKGIEFNKIWE